MESLMLDVIKQMRDTESSNSQKETALPLKKCVLERWNGRKDAIADNRTNRSSSFSILRSNVLQYVEDGGWNAQEVQEITTCVPVSSQDRKSARKTACPSQLEQDVTSCECPVTDKSRRDNLRPLALSQSCFQDEKSNSGTFPNQRNDFCLRADHSNGKCSGNKNLRGLTVIQPSEKAVSSPTSPSDYLTDLKRIYGSSEGLSSAESPDIAPSDSSTESPNVKCMSSDSVDGSSLQDTNISEPEGLSTYTLHNRWQEILPKEVVQQISRGNSSNKKHLLKHINEENTLTDSTQYFTDSQRGTSFADEDSIVLNHLNNECSSEFCWSKNGIIVEESTEDIRNCFNVEEFAAIAKTSASFDDTGNSCDSADDPSQKLSSIQDAYRSILKSIKKVNNGSLSSSYFGKKVRRSRKAKKDKAQPVYTCPECQSKYLVSSKRAIAISKCLKCEFWTSVNDEQFDEEEEVTVSFCCLS